MIFYWKNYNFLFKKILNKEKNYFFYFGIFSAIFLFLHVLFLGMEIENKIFAQLRRSIMVFFILSELFAQISLTRQLFKCSQTLTTYCYLNIMFFRNLSNSQSAACWVLCGVLAYAYNFLEEKEMNIDKKGDSKTIDSTIGPKRKES